MHALKNSTTQLNKTDEYRIVQYPDSSSKTGLVFFVDKKVKKRFLFFFTKTDWETVTWSNGESIYWIRLSDCQTDVDKLKAGKKIYQ